MEVDEKNLLGLRWNSPSFVSFGTEKNIINKKMMIKTSDPVWGLNWVYMLVKKISSHFDIGIHMLLFIQYIKEFF